MMDGDPPHFQNLIIMTKNDDHDTAITAPCIGTVTTFRLKVKRKHKIKWHIQNDLFNECPDLDENMVELRFDTAAMSDDTNQSSPVLSVIKAKNGKIVARVHADPTKVPDGKYRYKVYYMSMLASDPQLDISGDCGGCGPGSGQ
jgi:hypothetical protein